MLTFIKKIYSNKEILPLFFKKGKVHYVFFLSGIASILACFVPVGTGFFINNILEKTDLLLALFFLLLVSIGAMAFDFFVRFLGIKSSKNFELALQKKLLKILSNANPNSQSKLGKGELSAKFLRDCTSISSIIGEQIIAISFAFVGLICSLIIVFYKNLLVGCIFLISVPICVFIIAPFGRKICNLNHILRKKSDEAGNRVYEFLSSFSYLKSLSALSPLDKKLKDGFTELKQSDEHLEKIHLYFATTILLILFVGEYSVLFVGGYLAFDGLISIGDVVVFQMLFLQALGAFSNLFRIYPWIGMAQEALISLNELFTFSGIEKDKGKFDLSNFSGNVLMENVSFSYLDKDKLVIENYSGKFETGKSYAISGNNGAGKTTFAKLLTAYAEPTSGKIFFDGLESRKINRESLRKNISILFQDSILIAGTILENITLGQDYSKEELLRIISLCDLENIINNAPDGLDTQLGEKHSLSGGERQRIALARALIRKPKLVIFDEISNHLDFIGIESIIKIIEDLKKKSTVIIITHDEKIKALADIEIKF